MFHVFLAQNSKILVHSHIEARIMYTFLLCI